MRPFYFGPSQTPLFGIHHPPVGRPAGGVVLCNPFGHEAIRAHRIYRVMAAKLSRAGFHVLRFDYLGTGDSAGTPHDGNQARWVRDIIECSEELASLTGDQRPIWIGLRYGATLAALAAAEAPHELRELVLWDPVVSGRRYLEELASTHLAFMREDLPGWRPPPNHDEALGFPLGPDLRRAIEAIDLSAPPPFRARRVTVVRSSPYEWTAATFSNPGGWGPSTRELRVQSTSPWNSDRAMNASLVPIEIVDAVVECVREGAR